MGVITKPDTNLPIPFAVFKKALNQLNERIKNFPIFFQNYLTQEGAVANGKGIEVENFKSRKDVFELVIWVENEKK